MGSRELLQQQPALYVVRLPEDLRHLLRARPAGARRVPLNASAGILVCSLSAVRSQQPALQAWLFQLVCFDKTQHICKGREIVALHCMPYEDCQSGLDRTESGLSSLPGSWGLS